MATSLRSETATLVGLANRDLARLWQLVADGASAEVALRDLLPAIVMEYGTAGAALASEWYDEQRLKAAVSGDYSATPIAADDRGAQALIGWALSEARDDTSLATLISGGVQRRIADHVRYTVARNSVEDRAARGWQRVGVGTSCPFCALLIGRGAVYSETTVDFAAHDHCNCAVTPAWRDQPLPVKPYVRSARYVDDESKRAKQNAALRDYIESRGY